MELTCRISNGSVRINFDPNCIQSDKIKEIYEYLKTDKIVGKITWYDDPIALRKGVIEGVYNPIITSDRMARKAVQNLEDYIRKYEKE